MSSLPIRFFTVPQVAETTLRQDSTPCGGIVTRHTADSANARLADASAPSGDGVAVVQKLIANGEEARIEFKAGMRFSELDATRGHRLRQNALRATAAILNYDGGHMLVGVADDDAVIGFENTRFLSDERCLVFVAIGRSAWDWTTPATSFTGCFVSGGEGSPGVTARRARLRPFWKTASTCGMARLRWICNFMRSVSTFESAFRCCLLLTGPSSGTP